MKIHILLKAMMEFNHIGIFVKTLENGRDELDKLFGIKKWYEPIIDDVQGVKVQFGYDSCGICYELVAPHSKINPVDNVLSQGKNILNHVAYKVDNIEEAIKRLQNLNNILITGPIKAKAFDNKRIAFLFTKLRFIIELIEK